MGELAGGVLEALVRILESGGFASEVVVERVGAKIDRGREFECDLRLDTMGRDDTEGREGKRYRLEVTEES